MTIQRMHLVAVVLIIAGSLVTQVFAAQFRIAVALPLTGSMQVVAVGAREVLDASLDDVNQWARSTGSNHSFSLQVIDTEGRLSTGVKAVFDAARSNAVGVIGEYASGITIPMTLAGNNFPLWQCSGSATSPDLSNKTTFPYFYRSIPSDSAQGGMMAKFVKLMSWKNVAILFASDAYGTGVMSTFTSEAQRLNINIATSQSFTSGDEASYTLALEAVQNAGTRVVMFMGTYVDYIPVARLARKRGMVNDDWVYVASEGLSGVVEELKKPEYSSTDKENMNGLLFTFPLERGPGAKEFIDNVYRRRFPQRTDVQSYALFYRECLMTMARGLVRLAGSIGETAVLERRYPNTVNIQSLLTSYTGLTGPVNYDQNGDRVSDFAVMNVFNMQIQQAWTLPVSSDQIVAVNQPRFFSGTNKVPSDVPAFMLGYVTYGSVGGILLLGLLGIVAFGIIGTIVYLYTKRNTVAVKNMSLIFLVIISFGLLLVLGAQTMWLDVPSNMTCNLQAILLLLGMELVLSAVAAKTFRIWKIFDNKTLSKLDSMSNPRLIMGCMAIVSIQGALLLGWIMMSPLQPVIVASTSAISYECRSPNATVEMVFKTASLIYNGILLIVLAVLAYKTRKAYSAFRESVFISYSVQNIFLCGVVVAPFLYLSRKDFALAAFFIKFSAVLYCVCFSFGCLVGRIAMALVLANKNDVGVKMSMEGGSSSDGTSSAEHVPGKASTLHGKYPVKISNRLFETWHTQRLTLFALEGFLGLTRLANQTEQGKLFRLRSLQFDPAPSAYPLCIEIRADSASYLIQFSKEEDKAKWVRALSVHCLVMSKSSANRSTSGNQPGQLGGMSYTMSQTGGAARSGVGAAWQQSMIQHK